MLQEAVLGRVQETQANFSAESRLRRLVYCCAAPHVVMPAQSTCFPRLAHLVRVMLRLFKDESLPQENEVR